MKKKMREEEKRLKNKFALITGGTRGIGLETARQFIAEGATLAITGRDEEALAAAKQELGESTLTIRSDAGNMEDQRQLVERLTREWGRLDVLFVNAGDVTYALFEEWEESAWDRMMATNVKGPFFLIQSLLPLFANPASIILCGSASIHLGVPKSSVYVASKAALSSLARSLSSELIKRGIRLNVLSPGPINTLAQARRGLPKELEEERDVRIKRLVPLGRLGTPWEVAKAALFLASAESSFVVGTELLVDGGMASL